MVKDPNLLWFAFQPNSVVDITEDKLDFELALLRLKQQLNEMGFHISSLGCNMRSTREISKIQLKSQDSYHEMREYIPTLKSSITGKLPVLIPFQKIIEIKNPKLSFLMKDVICSEDTTWESNWAILHDSTYNSHEIARELMTTNSTKEIKVYADDKNEKDNLKDLEHFVYSKNTVLITNAKFFTGCEAANILYLWDSDNYDAKDSIRCSMFRAVERLFVIYMFNEDDNFRLDGFCVETKYLECQKMVKSTCYECKTCRLKNVCFSCKHSCHHEHELKLVHTLDIVKCDCAEKSCKINP